MVFWAWMTVQAMGNRLKSDLLKRAAMCANRLNDDEKTMGLAKRILLKAFSIRRQMAFMGERGKYAELLEAFADRPGHGTLKLRFGLLKPRAEVLAFLKSGDEAIAKFKEALAIKGLSAKERAECEKRIKELESAAQEDYGNAVSCRC